jgi:trimethylamine--corrinoid protein Co-methyltransferase
MNLWSEEAIEAIHDASIALLQRGGVRVESEAARAILFAAGCKPGVTDRVLIPAGVVEQALATLPRQFTLAARNVERSLIMDPEPAQTYVHNMGGASTMIDPRTGLSTLATVKDQTVLARVMHSLTNQHEVCPLVMPQDVPGDLEPLYSFLVLANETDKPLGGPGISHPFQAEYVVEMAKVVTGASGEGGVYPVDIAFSPVSPLLLGAEVTDAMLDALRRGQVVVEILPCPAAATTAPGAIAAAVATQNVEALAGIVLAQIAAPGTPMYYGPRLSATDSRTGVVTSGTPETGVSAVAATLLARRYGLACDCYGPTTDSKIIDVQLGYEHALNAIIGMAARPRFLSGFGDIQAGVGSSPEVLLIDDEILNYCFYAFAERPWDGDALDVDAMIEGAVSGQGYLGTKHTRRYIHTDLAIPLLSYRGGLTEWEALGHSSLVDIASENVAEIVGRGAYGCPDEIIEELCGLIDKAARQIGMAEWPDPRRMIGIV